MVEAISKTGMPLGEFIRLNNEQPFELIIGRKRAKVPWTFHETPLQRRSTA